MNTRSKNTMLTALILVALSSGTASAASYDNRLNQGVQEDNTILVNQYGQKVPDKAALDSEHGEGVEFQAAQAEESNQDKPGNNDNESLQSDTRISSRRLPSLQWESLDDARKNSRQNVAYTLSPQPPKPIIITAKDVLQEEKAARRKLKTAAKDTEQPSIVAAGMHKQEDKAQNITDTNNDISFDTESAAAVNSRIDIAHDTNMGEHQDALINESVDNSRDTFNALTDNNNEPIVNDMGNNPVAPIADHVLTVNSGVDSKVDNVQPVYNMEASNIMAEEPNRALPLQERDIVIAVYDDNDYVTGMRPRYGHLPYDRFTLTAQKNNSNVVTYPSVFKELTPYCQGAAVNTLNGIGKVDGTDRYEEAEGLVATTIKQDEAIKELDIEQIAAQVDVSDLSGISDSVKYNIIAGELSMRIKLAQNTDTQSVVDLTKILKNNNELTRLQKIDYLIGFGRAINRSGFSKRQKDELIQAVADNF